MMQNQELARAWYYALLANLLYAAPSEQLLHVIAEVESDEAMAQNPLTQAMENLRMASRAMDADAAAEEFQTLFIGAGSGGEVIPYASWHLTGFLMEEPLAKLRMDLASLGYDRSEGVTEPEDHIAALCETMRLLIESGAPLVRQKRFFTEHIAAWWEVFATQLEQAPSANYYRRVAALLRAFLQVETASFDMVSDTAEI